MKNQVLSIERMQYLKELGVDTSKASVYWARRVPGCDIRDESKGEWFLSLQKDFMTRGFISYEVIPTFTFYDIIEMINKNISGHTLLVSGSSTAYKDASLNTLKVFFNKGILNNSYNMLCWLAENKLLGKEEKK